MPSYTDRLIAVAMAEPLFPVGHFTPDSRSAFVGTPPYRTRFVCMVTHHTGAELGVGAGRHRFPPQVDLEDGYGGFGSPVDGYTPTVVGRTKEQIEADAKAQRRGKGKARTQKVA
jgi:hypothetical protein